MRQEVAIGVTGDAGSATKEYAVISETKCRNCLA